MTAIKHNVADLLWKSPGVGIQILSVTLHEGISELYTLQAEVVSAKPSEGFADMLGARATLELR